MYNTDMKMRRMKKRHGILALIVAVSMVISAAPIYGTTAGDSTDDKEIIIYHTNDTHGYLQGDGESVIGLPLVAGLKDSHEGSILVDAGDATQGLPLASLTKGSDVIKLMNLAGYDVMAAGNHEFDFGTDVLLENVKLADFPILCANAYRHGKLLLGDGQQGGAGCHTIVQRDGVKIGFFGLITRSTATSTNPSGLAGVEFTDEIEAARSEIQHLENEGTDVIIAVAHLGDETGGVPCSSSDLADAMTGEYYGKLDAIIDGHSHTVENKEVNGVHIAQTGTGLSKVGKMTLTVDGSGTVDVEEELLGLENLASVTPDAAVNEYMEEVIASQETILGEKVGETPTTLWGGNIGKVPPARFVETNYGNLAADAVAASARMLIAETAEGEDKNIPVVAAENGGGIRTAVANGDITVGDLVFTFPFSNTIFIKKITPRILYQVMEQSGSRLNGQDPDTGMLLQTSVSGGFLQISGFKVVFDPDAAQGSRVVSITLDGQQQPLDRNDDKTEIFFASNNFIMSGGNDYSMLAGIEKYAEAGGEMEIIESYVKSCLKDGVLKGYQGTEGRISYTGGSYKAGNYVASVRIVDSEGAPLAGKDVSYRVDGGEARRGTTDAEGILKITVTDGGHGIRISDSDREVYIDNYAGIGIKVDDLRAMPQLTAPSPGSEIPVEEDQESSDSAAATGDDVGSNLMMAAIFMAVAAAGVYGTRKIRR